MSKEGKKAARRVSNALVLVLAMIAAVVATGLIAGWSMWPWIVGYWYTLMAKNLADWIGGWKV